MGKYGIAFLLGVLSFLLIMFVGETAGLPGAGAAAAVYFCLCQFLLSRGNIGAHRDWPLMLTLDAVNLLVTVGMIIAEKWPVILSQAPVVLLIPCGATYLGAALASLAAKRRGRSTAEEV